MNFYKGNPDPEYLNILDDLEPWEHIDGDIYDLLVKLELFPSRGQAKKNFKGPIPAPGFNLYERQGKKRITFCFYIDKPYNYDSMYTREENLAIKLILDGAVRLCEGKA